MVKFTDVLITIIFIIGLIRCCEWIYKGSLSLYKRMLTSSSNNKSMIEIKSEEENKKTNDDNVTEDEIESIF